MTEEMDAFDKAKTWDLVPRPTDANIVRCMWLYKHKFDADGNPKRHKSRLVANGKSQEEGVDYTTLSHWWLSQQRSVLFWMLVLRETAYSSTRRQKRVLTWRIGGDNIHATITRLCESRVSESCLQTQTTRLS